MPIASLCAAHSRWIFSSRCARRTVSARVRNGLKFGRNKRQPHRHWLVLFFRPAEAEDFYASPYRSEPSRFVRAHEYKLADRAGGVVGRPAEAQRHAWIKKGRAEWPFLPMRNYDRPNSRARRKEPIDRSVPSERLLRDYLSRYMNLPWPEHPEHSRSF